MYDHTLLQNLQESNKKTRGATKLNSEYISRALPIPLITIIVKHKIYDANEAAPCQMEKLF